MPARSDSLVHVFGTEVLAQARADRGRGLDGPDWEGLDAGQAPVNTPTATDVRTAVDSPAVYGVPLAVGLSARPTGGIGDGEIDTERGCARTDVAHIHVPGAADGDASPCSPKPPPPHPPNAPPPTGTGPRPSLTDHVDAVHRHCRYPGCHRPARHCDKDHIHPWRPDGRGGRTCTNNLIPACRFHHRMKHSPRWAVRLNADNSVTWATPTGHHWTDPPPTIWD